MNAQTNHNCPACGAPLGSKTVEHLGYRLRACDACGLWFWSDRTTPDYDAVYSTAEYEEAQVNPMTTNCDPTAFRNLPTYASFFREVPQKAGSSLLDVGCGVGRFLVAARDVGWTTQGIDVSQKAVEIGRTGAGLNLSCATLEELHANGDRFDAVTAFEVLEHVQQPVEVVQSALAVVQPGKFFFCTVPNRDCPTVLKTVRPDWLPPVHLQFYTAESIKRLLQRAGGTNVRTGYILDEFTPRRLRGKIRQLARLLTTGSRHEPLGIWGIAQRD